LVIPAIDQTANADVQVRLSLAGGKSVYRAGEPIRLALSFTSEVDGYKLNVTTTKPASPVDEILVAPDDGVFRWLDEYSGKDRYSPDYLMMRKITTTPAVVGLTLNDLFRFDHPGKYTVQVKTRRVSDAERPHDPVPIIKLVTNEVIFEVVAMTETEEAQEVRRLSSLLNAAGNHQEEARISEELSYLAGEASTREKARRYTSSDGRSGNSYENIFYGLFIARDRALAMQLLEGALRDPHMPVTHQFLHTLTRLRLLQEGGEPPSAGGFYEPGNPNQQRYSEIQEEYLRELVASLAKRTGKNRTTTAMTILLNSPKDPDRPAPMLKAARRILLQEFEGLSINDKELLLNFCWDKFRDPSIQPALERMLMKNIMRASVLKRLIELDPDRSRSFVVAELIDPDSFVDVGVLAALKDETLPEADAALLEQIRRLAPLKQTRDTVPLQRKTQLAARYASPVIYEGLLEVYQNWGAKWAVEARAGLLGYLARYNEAQAMPLIEQSLEELGPDRGSWFLSNLTLWNYPKALDEYLRKKLESDDPYWATTASYIMSQRGQVEDMRFIEARLDRWVKEWKARGAELDAADQDQKIPMQSMTQVNLISALMNGKAWKLPEEKIKQLKQTCVTKTCRENFNLDKEVKK
jgi:hypothetical protein